MYVGMVVESIFVICKKKEKKKERKIEQKLETGTEAVITVEKNITQYCSVLFSTVAGSKVN